MDRLFELRAGPGALAQLNDRGLSPADIACVPAAAGGPKGLAMLPLDRLLWREWLRKTPRLELVGASIGAMRVAALAQPDPLAALDRLQRAYVVDQRYPGIPRPAEVSKVCMQVASAVLDGRPDLTVREGVSLTIITARARGVLRDRTSLLAFICAGLDNVLSRARLARHLERVMFHCGPSFLGQDFDDFGAQRVPADRHNTLGALIATGSVPLFCNPVRDIAGARPGNYWDGALVDYQMHLPFQLLTRRNPGAPGLVLYPHYSTHVTAGWFDSFLPWRRRAAVDPWLSDMLLIAPSRSFINTLPGRKLPNSRDFIRFRSDNDARICAWQRSIAECERFAEAVLRWMERPDISLVEKL